MPRGEPLVWETGTLPPGAWREAQAGSNLQMAAAFAASAGESRDVAALNREVCDVAAEGLRAEFAQLLLHDPGTGQFHPVAGRGWQTEGAGRAQFAVDSATAAGVVLQTGQAVVVNDPGVDSRFRAAGLAADGSLHRSIVVPVLEGGAAMGVLEVGRARGGMFVETDTYFLSLLARSLAAAYSRLQRGAAPGATDLEGEAERPLVAIQELQHRIRNDLQVICSSIDREVQKLGDLPQRAGYARLERQVMAIADLYQHLRITEAAEVVDMGAYLRSLGHRMTVASDLRARGIELVVDAALVCLPPRTAKSLAIVVNELVANAAEHAFPDGRTGTIALCLCAVATDTGALRTELTVSDDGCGFEQRRPGRAGLMLVECMVHAAGGLIRRIAGAGTAWQIIL